MEGRLDICLEHRIILESRESSQWVSSVLLVLLESPDMSDAARHEESGCHCSPDTTNGLIVWQFLDYLLSERWSDATVLGSNGW